MRTLTAPLALLLLSACGGAEDSSEPVQVPANLAPSFTSTGTASVEENLAAAYQATATDPEGQTITFALSGGADAALFTLSSSGQLAFRQPPSFETRRDADGDNVYLATLSASDGTNTTQLPVAITVTNSREGIAVRRLSTAFNDPVAVVALPDSRDVLIGERNGQVWRFNSETGARTLFSTVRGFDSISGPRELDTRGSNGLISLAVRSDFAIRPTVYASYAETPPTSNGNTLLSVSGSRPAGERQFLFEGPVFGLAMGTSGTSLGGALVTGSDGAFYLFTGDGGDGRAGGSAAQDLGDRRGKILRIARLDDPFAGASVPQFPYSVTILARGLQNPQGASISSGQLLFGDRGSTAFEEVNVFGFGGVVTNYGWPFLEGPRVLRSDPPANTTPPSLFYERGSGRMAGTGVVGGSAYVGAITGLQGEYVFADIGGAIWTTSTPALRSAASTLSIIPFERRDEDFRPDMGTITAPVALTLVSAGRILIIDRDGAIYVADRAG